MNEAELQKFMKENEDFLWSTLRDTGKTNLSDIFTNYLEQKKKFEAADKKHDKKEKMDEAKLAKKDYDKDGKIESPKDEVWGSRLRAAKKAGKLEEEPVDYLGKSTVTQDRDPRATSYDKTLPKVYPGAASSAPTAARLSNAKAAVTPIKENKISDIRGMVESDGTLHEMNINGKTVTLNTSMAKRILEVYDSVNTKNKKIVESMLNEDLESFKKLLNFSIKA